MRSHLVVAAATIGGLLASFPVAIGLAQPAPQLGAPIMPLADVKPGMKGYGLTVFRGTEPERFDVEVIGVLHNFRPHQDLVLIKTPHPRLEVARVVAGMSGSPIFLEGKMIGAYAYGWQFPSEAVAGVTPIQSMLDEAARPLPPMLTPLPVPPKKQPKIADASTDRGGTRFAGDVGSYDLREHARQLARSLDFGRGEGDVAIRPAATPILLGGMTDGATKLARDLLEPLGLDPMQGGGAGTTQDPNAPTRFVDGGAIGVQLVRGDVSAMGLGTVTRVAGDKLVAFGHPMMEAGVSALPTAIGRVLWVMATQARSFKIGEAVRPVGALVNDRQAAIVVDQKAVAPTFPVTCDIEGVDGAPHPRWSFTVAHEKFMAPTFLAVAVGNAFEATSSERRDVTWTAETEIAVQGHGTLRLDDYGVSVGGTPDAGDWARSHAVRALGALLNNPWEPVRIESVATRFHVRFAHDSYRLRGSEALSEEIDAGQPAKIRVHLVPWAGPEETRVVEVPIPRELAGKDVEIELTPGYETVPDAAAPEQLSELMANLERDSYAPDALVASIKLPEQGVAYRGHVASRLPPGALDVLRPAHDTDSPEPIASYVRTSIPIHRFLEGKDRVKVHVRTPMR